jgi:hypothetical protein
VTLRLIFLGVCSAGVLAIMIALVVKEINLTLPARANLVGRNATLVAPMELLGQGARNGEPRICIRFREGTTVHTAFVREEGFLSDLADLRAVLAVPEGARMTLLTSEGIPDLFQASAPTEVWELAYDGRTLLSYDQTSKARRDARRRHIEVFAVLFATMALTLFVIWLNRNRPEGPSAWDRG